MALIWVGDEDDVCLPGLFLSIFYQPTVFYQPTAQRREGIQSNFASLSGGGWWWPRHGPQCQLVPMAMSGAEHILSLFVTGYYLSAWNISWRAIYCGQWLLSTLKEERWYKAGPFPAVRLSLPASIQQKTKQNSPNKKTLNSQEIGNPN